MNLFVPFPTLQTKRLILRQLKESDNEVVLYLRTDKSINKYIKRPKKRQTKHIEDATNHIIKLRHLAATNKAIAWGISLKGKSQLIGSISLWNFSKDGTSAEVGYDLSPNFQNKGIMTEALQKVIAYGKNQLNLFYIEAYTHKENMNSIKLLEHNNFYLVQERKDAGNLKNIIYQINCKQN